MTTMSTPLHPQKGFTIVEIAIVLAITSILLVSTSIFLVNLRSHQTLDGDARQLVAVLKSAQQQSVGQESDAHWGVFVEQPSGDHGTYTLYTVDDTMLAHYDPATMPGVTAQRVTLRNGVVFTDPTNDGSTNIYFSRGTGLPNTSTTISLATTRAPIMTLTIYISSNGRIEYR